MENVEEDYDSQEEEQSPIDTVKFDINAWRRRRSLANAQNPMFARRLSQGENMCGFYNSMTQLIFQSSYLFSFCIYF